MAEQAGKLDFVIAAIAILSMIAGASLAQDSGTPQEVTFQVFRTLDVPFMGTEKQMCNHYTLTITKGGQPVDLGVGGGIAEGTNGVLTISLTPGDYSYEISFNYAGYGDDNPSQSGVTENDFTVTEGTLAFLEVDTSKPPMPMQNSKPRDTGIAHIGWAKPNLGEAEAKVPDRGSLIQTSDWGEVPANQVMVMLKDGAGKSDADSLAASLGGQIVGSFEFINLYQIEISGTTEDDLKNAVSKAKEDANVENAFPNQQANVDASTQGTSCTPLDDQVYSEDDRGMGYKIVGVQDAWDIIKGSRLALSDVNVGVTDDGLYKGYGEFDGDTKVDTSVPYSELNAPLIEYKKDGSIKSDFLIPGSHGTGVMNILAADPDNGGLTGIASQPLRSKLTATMINIWASPYGENPETFADPSDPTKIVLGDGRTYAIGGLLAFKKEIETGSTILSCSWGTSDYKTADKAWATAYRKFFGKMAKDYPSILFVCAAGNNYTSMDGSRYWPSGANLPNMITVGNIMNDGTRTDSSNMASPNFEVTLAAPGQQSVWGRDNKGNIKNNYGGTSMATPHVTAAAALIRSLDPSLSAEDIKNILVSTGRTSLDLGGSSIAAPPELGGRILAIDQAVLRAINDLRKKKGLTELSISEALASSRINLKAESDPVSPRVWTVTVYVPAVEGGTDVSLEIQGGSISESSTRHLDQDGSVNWTVTTDQETAIVVVKRLDTGGCSKAKLITEDVSGSQISTVKLISYALARDFDENAGKPTGLTNDFTSQDDKVHLYLKIGPVCGSHQVAWKWYSPDGTQYRNSNLTVDPGSKGMDHYDSRWIGDSIYVKGYNAEKMPGSWRVEASLDGQYLLTEQFTIAEQDSGGALGQLDSLNVEVANQVYTESDKRLYYCLSNGLLSYKNRIYLTGPDLNKIAMVTYVLDPSFVQADITTQDPTNDFEIWIQTWGRFSMKAIITTRSGQVFEKDFYLTFKSKVEEAIAMGVPQVEQCQ